MRSGGAAGRGAVGIAAPGDLWLTATRRKGGGEERGRRVTSGRRPSPRRPSPRAGGRGRAETVLLLLAAGGLAGGVAIRQADPAAGFTVAGVAAALAAELPTTLPAAVLVAVAAAANAAAGAILLRFLRRAPFACWSDLILGGYAGAVLLDALLLYGLGGAGLFRQAVLAVALVATLAAGLARRRAAGPRTGPPVRRPPRAGRTPPPRWLLIGLVWCGPILLSLASPVVPAADVLPNHVAPVEHLRLFGAVGSLATYPSPLYGPSRLFLGYVAWMGTLATLAGLPAALAVAASVGPLVVLSAVAVRRFASAAFGTEAGFWALLAFALSFTFVRLPDARDSVAALPLAAFSLALLAAPAREDRRARPPGRPDWLLAAGLAAATLVHPLVGTLAMGTVALLVVADPGRYAARAIPALAAAGIAVLPQAAVMAGLAPAPTWGIVAFAAAAAVLVGTARVVDRVPWSRVSPRAATRSLVLGALLCLAVVGAAEPGALPRAAGWLNPAFPLLFLGAGLAAAGLVPAVRGGRRLLLAALAVGAALLVAVALVPGSSLLAGSLRYEVPKSIGYWLPWACVPATAGLVAAALRRRRAGVLRLVPAGALLAIVVLPLGSPAPNAAQASHAVADDLAYDLRTAELGYWQGYPDARLVVDAAGRRLLGFLGEERSSGRLGREPSLLHVAASYQPWASLPIAAFAGIEETVVCRDATPDIFTAGGRIDPLATLDGLLRRGFSAVVLEPAGLPGAVRPAILAAGYRSVFSNASGEVFLPPAPPAGTAPAGP